MKAIGVAMAAGALASALLLAGCASESSSDSTGGATAPQEQTVKVFGNVVNRELQWHEGMTLAQAVVQANYQGQGPPHQVWVVRKGQKPVYFDYSTLMGGTDMQLQAGDQVEVVQ